MLHDLRHGLRGLARNPGFALAAILTLVLGIGAVTSIFSVADAVLIRPLPYPKQDRLVMVWNQLLKIRLPEFALEDQTYNAYARANSFEATGAYRLSQANLTGMGDPAHVMTFEAGARLLPLLGAEPAIGRGFTDAENQPGHANVAILSHAFFMSHFGGDPNVIGRAIAVDGKPLTVVGVMGADFEFSRIDAPPDIWMPLELSATGQLGGGLEMLARLRPGVSIAAAQSELDAIARNVDQTFHYRRGPNGEDPGFHVNVVSLHDQLLGRFRTATILLLTAVAAVLLIALANVANLLLVRAVSREQEFSVRRAIGASESRLARQLITEAALLVTVGGSLGAIASVWGVRALVALSPAALPAATRLTVDWRALTMTVALVAIVSILLGVTPLAAGRSNLRATGRSKRTAPALIAVEVALATMLLVSATLLLKSFTAMRHLGTGYRPEHVLTMSVDLYASHYSELREQAAFWAAIHDHLAAIPGVTAAGAVGLLPALGNMPNNHGGNPFTLEGRAWDPNAPVLQIAHTTTVDPDYFRAMQIPLLAGRAFTAADAANSPRVAVVNQVLARTFLPRGALGGHIMVGVPRDGSDWMTIVGIVGDTRSAIQDAPPMPQFYYPVAQAGSQYMHVVLRTIGDPEQVTHAAIAAIHSVDPDRPVYYIKTMEQHIALGMSEPRFETLVVGFFALAALFLAAVGIFGVVAHSTAQRTREIGIRIALGADQSRVLRHVIGSGLRPVAIGAAIGIAGALVAGRVLGSILFHVKPDDPATFVMIAGLLALVAVAACLGPARRAASIDPAAALRSE